MAATADFLDGLAAYLATGTGFTYRPTGKYNPSEVGIVFDTVPAQPTRLLVLTAYGDDDDPTQTDSSLLVQARSRGTTDPRTALDDQDVVFGKLQNLPRQTIGGLVVAGCWRRSTAYLGVDGSSRHERVSNWQFNLSRPTPNRF